MNIGTWFSGSGLKDYLLSKILTEENIQRVLQIFVKWIGQRILDAVQNGDTAALKALGNNMTQNTNAVVGALVKGTTAEGHVDSAVVNAAAAIAQMPETAAS